MLFYFQSIYKYKNFQIYLHNFSKFDDYFMIKYLAKIGITYYDNTNNMFTNVINNIIWIRVI